MKYIIAFTIFALYAAQVVYGDNLELGTKAKGDAIIYTKKVFHSAGTNYDKFVYPFHTKSTDERRVISKVYAEDLSADKSGKVDIADGGIGKDHVTVRFGSKSKIDDVNYELKIWAH